jgi:hypothetical protein
VIAGERKDRSEFGALPRKLRDQVIKGLDSGQMTLDEAVETIKGQGHQVSRTAMSVAYAKLRRARRRMRNQDTLTELMKEFTGQPNMQTFDALAKLLAAQAAEALLNDEESQPSTIKAVARALETMSQLARVDLEKSRLAAASKKAAKKDEPAADPAQVISDVYGIEL